MAPAFLSQFHISFHKPYLWHGRERRIYIYMDIFQLEVTGNIDVSIPNSNTKSGNHEELKLRFRLIFYCSYVKSSHVRYGL